MEEFKRIRRLQLHLTPSQVLVVGFLTLIGVGAVLLSLPVAQEANQHISFLDSLFTATSAVCVTGLVVVDTATQFSTLGEWIVLALIQAGGLGIMTLSALMLLLMGRRITLKDRLVMQEALGSFSIAGVVRLTRNIILTTAAIEGMGALLLALRWIGDFPFSKALYWGLFHAVSAFNNAGFDITSASMRPFAGDPFVLLVISSLVILGGAGFLVLEDCWRHKLQWDRLALHTRLVLRVTGLLLAVGTVLYLLLEFRNPQTFGAMNWLDRIVNAYFLAVTPRTAGFESVPTGLLMDVTLFVTIAFMFIGASPGGTGGGIKTTTFTLIWLTIKATVRGRDDIAVMGRRIPRDLLDKSVTIAAIAMGLVVVMTALLVLVETPMLLRPNSDMSFLKLMFETASAFGTVGLSTGITAELSALGKILIIITMFVGRVGPLTMAVALAQHRFFRDPLHYPEDRVMIG